ncbi:MAG: 4-hydroxythreonine-4-phosphate dehydrogenase PdxA, partial [Rhodospirillales bacterium]|nr:4-hydroxythreonine-4-phosphate dehydrogenase PdxA [Rhodospirillales bacterium]
MKPRIGVLLGDPNGVGPEIAVKLLADPAIGETADVLAIGDPGVLRQAETVAKISAPIKAIADVAEADWSASGLPFLEVPSIDPADVTPGEATAAGGRSCLTTLRVALALAKERRIDGFCFAPLNKYALKLGGCPVADEHIFFAEELGFKGPYCEHNVLGGLWTTRVSSHVPLTEVPRWITRDRIRIMSRL